MNNYDMSAGLVRIPLKSLVHVAAIAVKNTKTRMERYQAEIDNSRFMDTSPYHQNHHAQFYGRLLAEATQEYADALEIWFALKEAEKREVLEIIREV